MASPAALFEQVNDHHKFAIWNPFMKLDPNVKNNYRGPDSGVGAVCSWDGIEARSRTSGRAGVLTVNCT